MARDLSGWAHAFAGLRQDAANVGLSEAETERMLADARAMVEFHLAEGVRAEDLELLFMSERRGHGRLLVGPREALPGFNRQARCAAGAKRRVLH